MLDRAIERPTFYLLLQRYSMLGWTLFFITAFLFVSFVFWAQTVTANRSPLVIDSHGRLLGVVDPRGLQRSEDEFVTAAAVFLSHKNSRNSDTIIYDFSLATEMMTDELETMEVSAMVESGLLNEVITRRQRSHVEFDRSKSVQISNDRACSSILQERSAITLASLQSDGIIEHGTTMDADKACYTTVRMFGHVFINGQVIRPFDTTLHMVPVERTRQNIYGIEVSAIVDNVEVE